MKVEIRWLEERPGVEGSRGFRSFLKEVEEKVTSIAVEEAFRSWLDDKVRGKNIIVSDLEITVDDEFYILEREEENGFFQRIGAASGK